MKAWRRQQLPRPDTGRFYFQRCLFVLMAVGFGLKIEGLIRGARGLSAFNCFRGLGSSCVGFTFLAYRALPGLLCLGFPQGVVRCVTVAVRGALRGIYKGYSTVSSVNPKF